MPIYRFGPFSLNTKERTLVREGEPIFLRPKAFDLLALFAQRPGKLLNKDELMSSLWPEEKFVEESNLTGYVSTLRKALGEYEFIKTVSRQGYRFEAEVTPAQSEKPTLEAEDTNNETELLPYSEVEAFLQKNKWLLYGIDGYIEICRSPG
jgi:DNA-binding winged helix-turn-helix (wHTH) protein